MHKTISDSVTLMVRPSYLMVCDLSRMTLLDCSGVDT